MCSVVRCIDSSVTSYYDGGLFIIEGSRKWSFIFSLSGHYTYYNV